MGAMIMADDEERAAALDELLPLQQEDFEGLFEAMAGLPVTIRLLDPPLHEFLPNLPDLERRSSGADRAADDLEQLERRSSACEESTRRTRCSARAAAGSASCIPRSTRCRSRRSCARPCERAGRPAAVEIMIPLVDYERELEILRELVVRIGDEQGVTERRGLHGRDDDRAAAGVLRRRPDRRHADFFSFGTNDLTQTALGFSRDDVECEVRRALHRRKIIDRSPFETIDKPGVGWLVGSARGSAARRSRTQARICGEHGGDPRRSTSSTWPGSTTCPARRSACKEEEGRGEDILQKDKGE